MKSRVQTPYAETLELPPVYRLVTLREVGDAFAHAKTIAAEAGAGTLVYVGRFDLVEFAVVLEPDEPLAGARRSFYAGMAALGEALTFLAPPQKLVTFDWPDAIRVDGGLVGGGRLAWPERCASEAIPEWMVFGAVIRTVSMGADEPGLRPLVSALAEEGFEDFHSGQLVESFARHLMFMTDIWQAQGFEAMARHYLRYLTPEPGVRRSIDAAGDLHLRRVGKVQTERRSLLEGLAASTWLDSATGGPRA